MNMKNLISMIIIVNLFEDNYQMIIQFIILYVPTTKIVMIVKFYYVTIKILMKKLKKIKEL